MAVIALGAALALEGLDRHFFWFDEGLLLDIDSLHQNARGYVLSIWRNTTYNPGWALLVWLTTHLAGLSLWVARLPSFLAGLANIGMMFAAARALRLDRLTALAAALLTALAWPQVEYSQQVLPYAAVPLMTTLLLGALARLGQSDPEAPRPLLRWSLVLAAIGTVSVVNHNSILMLFPFMAFVALGIILNAAGSPVSVALLRFPVGSSLRPFIPAAACLAWIVLVSLVFYIPKSGEGYRTYLDPYYLTTFRNHLDTYDIPTIRDQKINYAPFL